MNYEVKRVLVWFSDWVKCLHNRFVFCICKQNKSGCKYWWRGFYSCPSVFDSKMETMDGRAREERTIANAVETQTNTVEYLVTAYCGCVKCCGKNDCITATGTQATEGRTIAIDPSVIPYGTSVYIDGVGTRFAEDCGGSINGNRIDLYFESHTDALNFGRQTKEVTILN